MIVAVAGIPSDHFNRIQKLAPGIFGNKAVFLGTPLRPGGDGNYRPDHDHVSSLAENMVKRIKLEPTLVKQGCGIIILAPEGYDAGPSEALFKPFALVRAAILPTPVLTNGRPGEMCGNQIARALRDVAAPLGRAVTAMNTEVRARLNRSPLLLPIRNFESELLQEVVLELAVTLPRAKDPNTTIAAACCRIEQEFPFGKIGGSSRRCFMNGKEVQFRPPNGALHGVAASSDPPHNRDCYLNGLLRLGGSYDPGFHYDCIRDRSEGRRRIPLVGKFYDCHGSFRPQTGDPHLNIGSNDFVRP